MESQLESKAEYHFESCKLDPDEFKYGPHDPRPQDQSILLAIREAPMKMWTLLLTIVYFVYQPISESHALIRCRKQSKKFKRELSKSYR